MTIASEIRKVRTLIDDTILTVENLHRSLAHTANMTGLGPADAKKTASRLEASLNTLRKRREELGGF